MTTIYKHTCTITNKSYIGKTKRTIKIRLNEHIKQSQKLKEIYSHFEYAIRKHGIENFTSEIIANNVPDYLSNPFEKYWIQYYNSIKNGYNMTEGGDGASLKGKQNGMYGKKHSKETKIKLSKSCKLNCPSGKQYHKTNTIIIYNKNGIEMFKSEGSFVKFCKDNKLPKCNLMNSYKNGGTPLYKNVTLFNKTRLIKSGMYKMKG